MEQPTSSCNFVILQAAGGETIKVTENLATQIPCIGEMLSLLHPHKKTSDVLVPLFNIEIEDLKLILKWIKLRERVPQKVDSPQTSLAPWEELLFRIEHLKGNLTNLLKAGDYLSLDEFCAAASHILTCSGLSPNSENELPAALFFNSSLTLDQLQQIEKSRFGYVINFESDDESAFYQCCGDDDGDLLALAMATQLHL